MIQPADLMFTFNKGNIVSESIAYFTHAKISHAQCIIDVGAGGTIQVISAEADGLTEKWVIPETLDWYGILTCHELTLRQRDQICSWHWNNKDTPYYFIGLLSYIINIYANNEARLYCSEAIYLSYVNSGCHLLDGVDHAYVSPRDLWISPKLKTLDGSNKEIR